MVDRDYFNNRRKERRVKFLQLLGGKCVRCGSTEDLHFDHKRPSQKEFNISKNLDAPEEILMKEIQKCQLLCGPCHKDKTLETEQYGKKSPHGTIWRYKRWGCRCEECKQAMSEYYFNKKED